jgi:hypothetical protein
MAMYVRKTVDLRSCKKQNPSNDKTAQRSEKKRVNKRVFRDPHPNLQVDSHNPPFVVYIVIVNVQRETSNKPG